MSFTSKSDQNAQKLRVVFLGDQGVGKTSIIEKYTTGKFDESQNATVGIDFNIKEVKRGDDVFRLQLWDTAGQERYRSLIPTYLKNAHCVVLVYDITKSSTFGSLSHWHNLFKQHQEAPGLIVGNKLDLMNGRKINKNKAEEFAAQLQMKYMQVSAKNGKKIDELFDLILQLIIQKPNNKTEEPNTSRFRFGTEQQIKKDGFPRHQKIETERIRRKSLCC